jgi:LPS-assembly protein
LETLFDDYLLFNGDATATHFYRPNGKRAVEGNFNIPLTLQTALFDDYIDVSYTLNASSKVIGFYANERANETGSVYERGKYAQLDHTLSVGTTLVKSYESTTHVINPFASYTSAGSRYYDGYYETYKDSCDITGTYAGYPCEFYTLSAPSDTLSLGVNNYLFQNGNQFLVDRLSQNFEYDDQRSYYGELQNELEWEITEAISYYNQTAYNHDRDRITKEQNTLRYNDDIVTASVSHYYTDELRNSTPKYASYWTADAAYQYNSHYRVFGLLAYDYREDLLKRSEVGIVYSQRCLDFGIRYVQNRRPILTNTNVSDSVNDSYIFITIILKPIGGSEFNYKLTK